LKEKFNTLVSNDKDLPGDKTALDRRVPTRWNSDLTCLDAHLYFRSPVEQLIGAAVNKLQAYRLSEEQWDLAETLSAILEVIILVFHKQITDFNFVTDFRRTNKTVFTISGSSYCRCLTYAGFH
jgi:hypothetical protein